MKKITYQLLHGMAYAISIFPFGMLYLLADIFFILVYYIVGYRRKVVKKNLKLAFPDKSEKELNAIEKQFFHWFCDYIVETIKLLSISNEDLLKHIEFRGVEELEKCYDKGQNCAAILGHYCNWEWLSASALAFKRHPNAVAGLIYHPLYNDAFNQLFIDIRSAHGGVCVPKKDILRYLVNYKREDRRSLFGYIADQAPWWTNIHLWVDFMHQETPVFTGGERIMRKMNDAVFYVDMERPKRGKYICTFRLLYSDAEKTEEFEITKKFFQMLETSICRQPAFYLWSHDRWKRTREEFNRRLMVVNGRVVWNEEAERAYQEELKLKKKKKGNIFQKLWKKQES
ncbi:lysophospholipid acyltransferase family protein [Prevotella sp. E2-28]|uniref:lysophospholipid acyltransferase family protein n=1 Tax=Prevotella sp. E2-28 TaxID=2913620 RepID=UPI001EDAEEE5|nr:lysophospholipid acyltransferase family protein [Prevotella sp. E2-28]UKK53534.1 lysophospholipid acyltransferase family protein [Prevotella sp. E2-28]